MKTEYLIGAGVVVGVAGYFYLQSKKTAAAAANPSVAQSSAYGANGASTAMPIPGLPMTGPNGTAISFPPSTPGATPTPLPVFTVPTPQGNVQVTPTDAIPTSIGAILNAIPTQSLAAVTSPMTLQEVQHSLNVLGANPALSEDGINGPQTVSAIAQFQTQHGLAVDGVAGTATQAAIQMALAAQQGVQTGTSSNPAPVDLSSLTLPPGVTIGPNGQIIGI